MDEQQVKSIVDQKFNDILKASQGLEIKDAESLTMYVKFSVVAAYNYLERETILNESVQVLQQNDEILDERTQVHENAVSSLSQATQNLLEQTQQLQGLAITLESKTSKLWKILLGSICVVVLVALSFGFSKLTNDWKIGIGSAAAGVILTYAVSSIIRGWNKF